MRDSERIPAILDRLGDLWSQMPDLRLGQLLYNLDYNSTALYFIEDEELIAALEKRYGDMAG